MLPFLRQGSAKISAEIALLNQQGVGNNFGGSGKLYQDWQKLDTAASNTADIFAQKLAPSADNVVNALTGFFSWLPHMNDPSAPYSDRYGKEKKQGSRMIWEASGYVPGPDGYYTKDGNRPIFIDPHAGSSITTRSICIMQVRTGQLGKMVNSPSSRICSLV